MDVPELGQDVGHLGRVLLGVVERLFGGAARIVADDNGHPPGLGRRRRSEAISLLQFGCWSRDCVWSAVPLSCRNNDGQSTGGKG